MRVAALYLAVASCCLGGNLGEQIDSAIEASPEASGAFWGIRVVDAASGSVVYAQNDSKFFIPASNTKLFTAALAMERLGPDYRFVTKVESTSPPDAKGRVTELRLIGGGDPNLSARILPYDPDPEKTNPNPLAAIEALADAAIANGLRTVDGDIVGDDTAYAWEPFPEGWSVDDPVWEYGAPVSALTLNDNAFTLRIAPGETAGDPGILSVWPAVEYLTIHNRTRTVLSGPAKLAFERLPGSRELIVTGTVAEEKTAVLAIDDPALYAASALREALENRGIRVTGGVRALHRRPGEEPSEWHGTELARHTSLPLAEALRVIAKVSQNLHTEMLLREIARAKDAAATRQSGLKEIAAFLKEIGVEDQQYNFADASGLSRLTLVTPAAITALLMHMEHSPLRDLWIGTLPVGGVDGTLEKRFGKNPAAAAIRAKTGSISHVSSLSGYALRSDGKTYVFSIVANNYNSPAAPVRRVIDQIALALLD